MKKRVWVLTPGVVGWVVATLLLMAGCDFMEKDKADEGLPLSSATDLPEFEGALASQTDAESLFLDVSSGLNTTLANNLPASPSTALILKSLRQGFLPKSTGPQSMDLTGQSFTAPDGGEIKIEKGTVKITTPDLSFMQNNLEPNKQYSFTSGGELDMVVSIKNVKIPGEGGVVYTVNGKHVVKSSVSSTVTFTAIQPYEGSMVGIDGNTLKMTMNLSMEMGMSLSVSGSNGKGGKFIFTFPKYTYNKSNLDLSPSSWEPEDLNNQLENQTVTISVYDKNSSTPAYTITCKAKDLEATNVVFAPMGSPPNLGGGSGGPY